MDRDRQVKLRGLRPSDFELPPLEPIFSPGSANNDSKDYVTLLVANFPYGTTETDLYLLFEDYNPICVNMVVNSPAQRYTFGYVTLPNRDIAEEAMFELDSTSFNKRQLVVCYALERIN